MPLLLQYKGLDSVVCQFTNILQQEIASKEGFPEGYPSEDLLQDDGGGPLRLQYIVPWQGQ